MTTDEFIKKQRKWFKRINAKQNPLALAASTVHSVYIPRIFEKGLNAAGRIIGKYKSKPYIRLREKRGRRVDRVNLFLEGGLMRDMASSLTLDKKNTWVTGTKNHTNSLIVGKMIKLYKEIAFKLSNSERKLFLKTIFTETVRLINA